mgnify:CR=1 FL=1
MRMSLAGLITTIGIIILGITDLCFVLFTGTPSTVSDFLIRAGFKAPMVVFAFGYVCGHLFGSMKLKTDAASEEELDQICKDHDSKK